MTSSLAFERHLIRENLLTEETLEHSRREAESRGISFVEGVEGLGFASAEELYRSLAGFCEMPFESPSKKTIAPELAEAVPVRFATHYDFVPLELREDTLVIAVSDPLNSHLLDDIRQVVNRRIEAVVATPEDIKKSAKALYGLGADTVEKILDDTSGASTGGLRLDVPTQSADLGDDTIDASVVKFVNELLVEAIAIGATDIHIEPFEDELRVRSRIDGVLHRVPTPASILGLHSAIVSRVKVMANLNIAEKRLPQDGKIRATVGDDAYDLRVSVLPTPHGETLNIRILSRASMFKSLTDLGFLQDDLEAIEGFLERPNGIVLLTGPTGSGKTTTLYASLNKLNLMDRKIITIEDPIEYQLKGITQMQIQPQIGLDFASGLRSMLRHDPDIMMVGEIRDYETAEMAIRASLTGHLVFSTLHTNDAAGAVTRLIDMGIEPFLIASTMIASIAQRLVRKVCESCGETVEPDERLLRDFGIPESEYGSGRYRAGKGCEVCRMTGYRGRLAIGEILPFTPEIKDLTVNRATALDFHAASRKLGLRNLRDSGWLRVKEGVTTVEEVLRVTSDGVRRSFGVAGTNDATI